MNVKFVINDYVLIWNLLFQASISESIYKLKQKLWVNYKNEYNNTYRDKAAILKDPKNFIPNDDTIYNIVFETKEYQKLRKETEKFRLNLMKVWDSNQKQIKRLLTKVIKDEQKDYLILLVNPELNIKEIIESKEDIKVILGKNIDKKDSEKVLIDTILSITKQIIKNKENDDIIRNSLIELAILNEFASDIYKRSCYITGDPKLERTKRFLYPYWLMYLGIPKSDFETFQMRDRVTFNKEQIAYEKELKKLSLGEMIDFCIRNKKYIIKIERLETL